MPFPHRQHLAPSQQSGVAPIPPHACPEAKQFVGRICSEAVTVTEHAPVALCVVVGVAVVTTAGGGTSVVGTTAVVVTEVQVVSLTSRLSAWGTGVDTATEVEASTLLGAGSGTDPEEPLTVPTKAFRFTAPLQEPAISRPPSPLSSTAPPVRLNEGLPVPIATWWALAPAGASTSCTLSPDLMVSLPALVRRATTKTESESESMPSNWQPALSEGRYQ
jgi:hypothetical protein